MEQYIPKAPVVAEIKGLIRANELYLSEPKTDEIRFQKVGAYSVLNDLLYSIDTLEVKEVNIDKEIEEEYLKRRCYGGRDNMLVILNEPQFNKIAKHFFELGIKAQKGNEL